MFTATVTPSGAAGSVQFADGGTVLGTASVSGGTAVYTTAALLPGAHTITASYLGSGNYTGSTSAGVGIAVTQMPTVTTMSASSNPVQAGAGTGTATVTLTASVSPGSAGGSVQFMDGTSNLGQPVQLTSGSAQTTVTLNVGVHSLTAVYGGDALDLPGTGAFSQTVYNTPVGSNVAVTDQAGNTVTFATVSGLGITSVATAPATDPSFPGPLTGNYQTGQPASFFTVTTTATVSGAVTVCLSYAGVSYGQPSTLTLLRFDTMATPPAWAPATGQINTQNSTSLRERGGAGQLHRGGGQHDDAGAELEREPVELWAERNADGDDDAWDGARVR